MTGSSLSIKELVLISIALNLPELHWEEFSQPEVLVWSHFGGSKLNWLGASQDETLVQCTQVLIVVVQLLSHIRLFATPWTAARQASLSFAISLSLIKLMSIEWVMPSNHLILSCPLLLLPSTFPSIRVFSYELALHIRWSKYWSICSSNEYSGLISFRIDWFDLLGVQGTLKSLVQHHSSKA